MSCSGEGDPDAAFPILKETRERELRIEGKKQKQKKRRRRKGIKKKRQYSILEQKNKWTARPTQVFSYNFF
jgi:hypothetical protein